MSAMKILLICLTAAGVARATFIPLGTWPVDATGTAVQIENELFRNCGRVLERWDLAVITPVLVDSLILASPPIDLLDWGGLLLVLREDGGLEARDPTADWSQTIWSMEGLPCATRLLRHGRWLLPVSPYMPLLDLEDPRQPVVAQEPLGGWDGFGGFDACFVGDTLLGDYYDCCGSCWDVVLDNRWMVLGNEAPQGSVQSVGWIPGLDWNYDSRLASADHLVLLSTWAGLQVLDPATWTLRQTLPRPGYPGEVTLDGGGNGPMALVSGPVGTIAFHSSALDDVPLAALDTLDFHADQQLRLMGDAALLVSEDEVRWITLQDPSQMETTRTLPAPGGIRAHAWAGSHLLARGTGLHILSPVGEAWALESTLPLGEGRKLAAHGQLAVADVPTGLCVVDLGASMPQALVHALSAPVTDLLMLDQVAVCLTGDSLRFLDLRTPSQPREITCVPSPGTVFLEGAGSVVAAGGNGVVQLFQATAEQVVAGDTLTIPIESMALVDSVLIIGRVRDPYWDPVLELRLWDVTNPQQAVQLGEQTIGSVASFAMRSGASRLGLLLRDYWPGWDPYDRLHLDLFDVVDGVLVRTVSENCEERPVKDFCLSMEAGQAGKVAIHDEGEGLSCYLDDSILTVDGPPFRPNALVLAAAPNPFNPLTRLSFNLTRPGPVRLAVFDLLGREVALPAAGHFSAGFHHIAFDAGALASGLYLARLEAEGRTAVAKLMLVR